MENVFEILKMIAVLVAAILIGNWFLAEVKRTRSQGGAWYQPYLSLPGILILVALTLPIIIWIITR